MKVYNYEHVRELLKEVYYEFNNNFYKSYTVASWDNYGHEEGLQVKLREHNQSVELWEYRGSGYDPYVEMITNDPNIIFRIITHLPPYNESVNFSYYMLKTNEENIHKL